MPRPPTITPIRRPSDSRSEWGDSRVMGIEWARRTAPPDRARVVELLDLNPGDVVLDVGCGTGLCFPLVVEQVGPKGRVIGIEQSLDMLTRAQERIEAAKWENVDLVLGSVEDAHIPV